MRLLIKSTICSYSRGVYVDQPDGLGELGEVLTKRVKVQDPIEIKPTDNPKFTVDEKAKTLTVQIGRKTQTLPIPDSAMRLRGRD